MFNKETEYVLRGLLYIQMQNLEGRRPGIQEIAGQIDAPRFYIAKILQRMVRLGLLESQKGKGGGFYFDENKPELSLKQLVTAAEGDKIFRGCGFGLRECDENNPCPLHEQFAPVRNALHRLVQEETVQQLARKFSGKSTNVSPRLK